MSIEAFNFDSGINRKKSRLYLSEGEVYTCEGFNLDEDGMLKARAAKTIGAAIDINSNSTINGLHRYDTSIYASSKAYCPGNQAFFNYIYHRLNTGSAFTLLGFLHHYNRPRFADYEKFTFAVDGGTRKAYVEDNVYDFGIPNPQIAPQVVAGAAGNPNGEYTCYVTFYIKFPNGKTVETGPSDSATITVTSDMINWSRIAICPYTGNDLMIHRRLYRTVSGTAYLVKTIQDNTTTIYTDDVTDAVLQVSTALGTDGYTVPPSNPIDIAVYLQRIFLIKDNKLYWSEPYQPFNFLITSDVTVSKDNEDLVAIANWGDQIFVVSNEEWYRLQGSDPDTWAIKRTFTDNGIINRHTLKKSKYGLIGLWNDGVYIFDGSINRNITLKKLGQSFFRDLDDLSVCYAEFDNTKYYLYYASSGTTIDSCLVIDFTHHPEHRVYFDNFIADEDFIYKPSFTRYLAKDGYEYSESGTETIATELVTGDRGFQGITKHKCLDYLYYDIDTDGKDVTVNILADGTSVQTLTLNTSSRQRKRSPKLKAAEGYRFALQIACADSQGLEIYSPWVLEATPVGD